MALTMEKLGEFYATFFQGLLEESEVRATRITVDAHITGTGTTPAAFSTGLTDTVAYDVYISTAPGSVGNVYQCTLGGNETTALWQYKFTLPAGAAGGDGTDAHVFFKYSAVNPAQDADLTDNPSAYIGVYSGPAASAPATWNSYAWYQWRGNNVFVKWSRTEPSQDSDLQDTPGPYIGVYVGAAVSAPTTYTSYMWYCIKGENGNGLVIKDVKADYATLLSEVANPAIGDAYAVGTSIPFTIYIYLMSGWTSFGTLSAAAAGDISIVDIGGYYESTTAEGALQEAGAALLQKANSVVIESGYDPAATYALGEFCIHNGAFFECTTAITSPEVWNAAHWTERTIGYVLKVLNDGKATAAQGAKADNATDFVTVNDVSNGFLVNTNNQAQINAAMTIANATAKTITASNIAMRCAIFLEITMTATAAITWTLNGGTVKWATLDGNAPVPTSGHIQRVWFETNDGGTNWIGYAVLEA